MIENLFCDIACKQQNYKDEKICGDTFLYRHTNGGARSIAVLSDGMGHGVKANILSTLTASIIINFDSQNDNISEFAKMVINTLPICSVRKVSYSTFSIIDINHSTGIATIVEYDNPRSLIFRDGKEYKCDEESYIIENGENKRKQIVIRKQFKFRDSDRIVFMSDGVTQSGTGTDRYPFGWKRDNVTKFILDAINTSKEISSKDLASKVLAEAVSNDSGYVNDDVSCGVVTIRKVRGLLLCSCPPISDDYNEKLVSIIDNHKGQKLICGYHLAKLISKVKGTEIIKDKISLDADIQPAWHMEGVDMISESLATLNKVYEMLQNLDAFSDIKGPAADVCNMLLENDSISMLIGLRRGKGGVYMVDEYELRRKVVKYIARILEEKYNKEIKLQFI